MLDDVCPLSLERSKPDSTSDLGPQGILSFLIIIEARCGGEDLEECWVTCVLCFCCLSHEGGKPDSTS